MSLVLDASVALAWCFEDEQTPAGMDHHLRTAATASGIDVLGVASE